MAKPMPKQRRQSLSSSSQRRRPSRRNAEEVQGRQGRNELAAYSYREDQIEDALATGKDADILKSYFAKPSIKSCESWRHRLNVGQSEVARGC